MKQSNPDLVYLAYDTDSVLHYYLMEHNSQSVLYVLLTVHLVIIFVNNQLDAQFFFMYVYFYSLHVLDSYVSIIRRINCINTTSGICHIDTINSPDDGHIDVRNMSRIEINIHEKELCIKLVIYKDPSQCFCKLWFILIH